MKTQKNIISLFLGVLMIANLFSMVFATQAQAANLDAIYSLTPKTKTVAPGQVFDIDVVIDNAGGQEIITAGFDISFPVASLEVVDSDTTKTGIQINSMSSDFSSDNEAVNTVNSTTGVINFVTGTKGQIPLTKKDILVATIPFRAKEGVKTTLADIKFMTSANTDVMITNVAGNPESIVKDKFNATVIISNIGLGFSPNYKKVNKGDVVDLNIVLDNPDKIDILTVAFELSFDDVKLLSQNNGDKVEVTIEDKENFQVVENQIKSTGTVIFTGGFTGNNKHESASYTIGTLSFEAKQDGTAYLRVNPDTLSSSVFTLNNATDNYLGKYDSAKIVIGEGDETTPTSEATPRGGTYSDVQRIRLSADDRDADIYYTLDGQSPSTRSSKYNNPIEITRTTTLKFFAVDQDGNEERVNTETYRIGIGNAAIGITAVKTELSPGEEVGVIVKLIDSSIHQAMPGKKIDVKNSGSGTITFQGADTTDAEGEILLNFKAGSTLGEDVITATLSEDGNVQGYLNMTVGSSDVKVLKVFGTALSTSTTNYISVTAENNVGEKINSVIPVTLFMTKKGTSETKEYSKETIDGIATFAIAGNDLNIGTTYQLIAKSNGLESNTIELSTPMNSTVVGGLRPGGGQPGTGPGLNLFIAFLFSMGGVYVFKFRLG